MAVGIRTTGARLHRAAERRRIALHRRAALRDAGRRVFVDCGANTCTVLRRFIAELPSFEFYAFEPQRELREHGAAVIAEHHGTAITFMPQAVWTADEPLEFYLARNWSVNHRGGSTLVKGQTGNDCEVDYSSPVRVEAIDFSRWLGANFSDRDYIIVKMDIEGAEYDVLEKMVADGTLPLVDELYVEFHQHMNPTISAARHERVAGIVRSTTSFQPWF